MTDNRKTFLNRSLADLGENGKEKKIVLCRVELSGLSQSDEDEGK